MWVPIVYNALYTVNGVTPLQSLKYRSPVHTCPCCAQAKFSQAVYIALFDVYPHVSAVNLSIHGDNISVSFSPPGRSEYSHNIDDFRNAYFASHL